MGTPGETPSSVPPRLAQVRSASTRELIAELAVTEEALREASCSAARRLELAQTQALIVRELRTRKTRWRH